MAAAPTLAEFKTQLAITVSTYDTALTAYLASAQSMVETMINGTIATTSYSEVVNCRGNGLNLSHRPLVTVDSLTPLLSTWPSFASTDVQFDPKAGTVWRKDLGTLAGAWTVAYTAGYGGVIPQNWWLAIILIGEDMWKTRRGSGTRRPGSGEPDDLQPSGAYAFPPIVEVLLAGADQTAPIA